MNFGLVRQAADAFRRFSVIELGKTYTALRIADVAKRTSPTPTDSAETANYVKDLIVSRQLKASITEIGSDLGSWVLRFEDGSAEAAPESQIYEDLTKAKEHMENLIAHIRESDRKLGLSREYLDYTKKIESKAATANPDASDEYAGLDEDMMVDS